MHCIRACLIFMFICFIHISFHMLQMTRIYSEYRATMFDKNLFADSTDHNSWSMPFFTRFSLLPQSYTCVQLLFLLSFVGPFWAFLTPLIVYTTSELRAFKCFAISSLEVVPSSAEGLLFITVGIFGFLPNTRWLGEKPWTFFKAFLLTHSRQQQSLESSLCPPSLFQPFLLAVRCTFQ